MVNVGKYTLHGCYVSKRIHIFVHNNYFLFLFLLKRKEISLPFGECREIFPYMDPMGLLSLKCLKLFVVVSSRFKIEVATWFLLFIV